MSIEPSVVVVSLTLLACGSSTPPPTSESTPSTSTASSGSPAAGKACTANADCEKGEICTGEAGCDTIWTCQPSRPCTRDLVQYCGCDGKMFESSGSCAGRKYSKKGPC